MGRRDFVGGGSGFELVDVDGSFERFVKNAPKEVRALLADGIEKTLFSLSRRISHNAPVGPDSPHIKDFVTFKRRGLSGTVGYIDATEKAGPENDATIAEVALYNEYAPNRQPFIRPSADAEAGDFVKRMKDIVGQVERNLSGGGGLV